MIEVELSGSCSRFGEHLWGHVDPDDTAGRPNLRGGNEGVKAGAGADIDDALACFEPAQRERVADTGKRLDRPIRKRVDDRLVVAEAGREWAAGMEVVGAMWVVGDVAVLVAYLCAKGVDIDECFVGHGHAPVPAAIGRPARFHSGKPSSRRRALNPRRRSWRTASSAYTQ